MRRPLLAGLLWALPAAVPAAEKLPGYDLHPIDWGQAVENLLPLDLDGDGLKDLVEAGTGGLKVHFQKKGEGFPARPPEAVLAIAGRAVGWCIAPLARGGRLHAAALIDGREARIWSFDPVRRAFSEPRALRSDLTGDLPGGFHHLPFLRDLNGDGLSDLVIPGTRGFHVHLASAEGAFGPELGVPAQIEVHSRLSGDGDLTSRVGQSVRFPLFTLRDLDGNGRADLLSETNDRVAGWLAGADGTFSAAPSFSFDLQAVRAQLGPNDLESLDYSNLTASLAKTAQLLLADVNGDRAEDALLRAGGKVSLFLSKKGGYEATRPDQVLKSSGNVFFAALDDEDGDGRADLWLVRIEAVTMGDLFLWLIASGKIDFDVFIYRNSEGRFASRPSRRITVTVRFASLLSIFDQFRALSAKESPGTVTRTGDLAGSGASCDLMVIEDGHLEAYLNSALTPKDDPEKKRKIIRVILEQCGYARDKDQYDLDLTDIAAFQARFEGQEPGRPKDKKPDLEMALAGAPSKPGVTLVDLNGDGRDDLILLYEWTPRRLRGAVLLSRSR